MTLTERTADGLKAQIAADLAEFTCETDLEAEIVTEISYIDYMIATSMDETDRITLTAEEAADLKRRLLEVRARMNLLAEARPWFGDLQSRWRLFANLLGGVPP